MNMILLMKIIEEETGKKITFEEVLKSSAVPGLKTMVDLNIKDIEVTYARWVKTLMSMKMEQHGMMALKKFLINLMKK